MMPMIDPDLISVVVLLVVVMAALLVPPGTGNAAAGAVAVAVVPTECACYTRIDPPLMDFLKGLNPSSVKPCAH